MRSSVTVSGGGIIGNYIASRLTSNNIESLVVEKSDGNNNQSENIRTLTLNPYSKKLLDDIGIKIPCAEIKTIKVFEGEGSGKIDFKAEEINEDNLSYVVFFNELQNLLQDEVLEKTLFKSEIRKITKKNSEDISEVLISNDKTIETKFIAGCDGRNSKVAKLAEYTEMTGDYNQTAITFTAKCYLEDKHAAYQIFSDKGIFAIMPLPSNKDDSTHTIVWSVDNEKLVNLNIEQYVDEYMPYFEGKLSSEINVNSSILSFKLFNHHFKNYVSGSTVLIGDAAHSIHPLAGQGINLGFADADAFCEEIENGFEKSINIDQRLVLKRYEVRRKNTNLIMLKSMDFFVNLFNSDNLYIKLLRNIGLSRVNKAQFLKKFFISHASGKNKI